MIILKFWAQSKRGILYSTCFYLNVHINFHFSLSLHLHFEVTRLDSKFCSPCIDLRERTKPKFEGHLRDYGGGQSKMLIREGHISNCALLTYLFNYLKYPTWREYFRRKKLIISLAFPRASQTSLHETSTSYAQSI